MRVINVFYIIIFISCTSLYACKKSKNYPTSCSQVTDNYHSFLVKAKDTTYKSKLLQSLIDISIDNPSCEHAYMLSCDIQLYFKNYQEAKGFLYKALTVNSQNVYTLFNLGKVYSYEKKYDSAIYFFKYAAKLKSNNGVVVQKTNEFYETTEQAVFDVEYFEIIFNNALASYHAHYLLDANNEFEYCIRNNKKLKESYFFLGLIYLEIQQYEKVCKNMLLAKENGNLEAEVYITKYCLQ